MDFELPLALGVMDNRPFYRCPHCSLVQFAARSGNCRRCLRALLVPKVIAAEELRDNTPLDRDSSIDNLPTRLEILQRASALTQSQIAKRSGVGRTGICRVRCGHQTPTLAWLERLSDAFVVPVAYLLRGVNGNFFVEICGELPRLNALQLKHLAYVVRLLATDHALGQRLVQDFLDMKVRP
jgi:transcriptional regulator with XRE-family HTH domain